jgi:GntR family transcriptional regulator/MocR family aminotransferase
MASLSRTPTPDPAIAIRLDRHAGRPLYRQVYDRLREAILGGVLRPGARLPSSRSLASQLAVARGTVELAYDMLSGEGYIVGRAAAGSIVTPGLDSALPSAGGRAQVNAAKVKSGQGEESGHVKPGRMKRPASGGAAILPGVAPLPFQLGLPALDAFPRKVWSRLAARHARSLSTAAMTQHDKAGDASLRREIVAYLAIARGITCEIEDVFVTAGFQGALTLIFLALLQRGDPVWIEDPGYFRARELLDLLGARLVPVPVDGEGLRVADGVRRCPEARLAMITPAHQCPLGMALSLPRRLELLAWAQRHGSFIIEDDYDSEFRYTGRPLPALKSLDADERVLYAGTFSKVLFPGLRMGYLVVPRAERARFRAAAALTSLLPAPADQATVADFMEAGHFARHIRRMRQLYGERRAALAGALRAAFGARAAVALEPGGMHLVMRLATEESDAAPARRANDAGLAVTALSAFTVSTSCPPSLVLGFTNIPAGTARREAERLRRALGWTG